MAERRMFTQKITDSDAFLDMPLSTQSLYFHLNMRADDDGFVNNPKKIQRMIGASEDDLKLLVAKRFIIAFDTGVIVIKHWRMHNLLRKDRYNPTQYAEEMDTLMIKDNGSYTEKVLEIPGEVIEIQSGNQLTTTWQPDDNQLATQDSIGKDSIGEISIEEDECSDSYEPEPLPTKKINLQAIVNLYNSICVSLPKVKSLSESRKKAIKARLNTYSVDDLKICFEKAESSDFLKGGNDRNWCANFDWLIKDANMAKVLDGNYDNKPKKSSGRKEPTPKWMSKDQQQYDFDELERNLLETNQSQKPELSPEYKKRLKICMHSLRRSGERSSMNRKVKKNLQGLK